MILSEAVTRVADDSRNNANVTTTYNRLVRTINRTCQEVWNSFRWTFRWRNYRIVTDVDYTTGSVSATNGSRTVTGVGTGFTSKHVGWHINFDADSIQNFYKVRAVTSSTQLELDVPYQGTSGTQKVYHLRHFDYTLPSEPWDLASVIVTYDRRTLALMEASSIEIVGPVPFYKGYPLAAAIYSSKTKISSYSTGTISGTVNTPTLTGVGTSWLDNVNPGDMVTINSIQYSILSVDSDTQITLYQNLQSTISASTYLITSQFERILRVMWPSTDNYTLDIRALRLYSPLVNNNDTNELLYRSPEAIITKAASIELKSQGDVRGQQLMAEAEIMIAKAKAEDDSLTPRDAVAPLHSYRNPRINRYRASY